MGVGDSFQLDAIIDCFRLSNVAYELDLGIRADMFSVGVEILDETAHSIRGRKRCRELEYHTRISGIEYWLERLAESVCE